MSAEVLKQRGVYDPKKLFGLMTPETELARAFVAERFVLYVEDVHVPVIGGHCSLTALPLFSKTTPPYREFFEARGAERFVLSLLRALGGANDMFQCCFVESNMFEDIPFFGSTVKLGKKGVEAIN
uniref:Lactate/malate dehydrogenase C-terminal domain-containing protein n=1 Tax=Brassica oleracea var. oleracea TaxID=109376 RepID=A0A0D3C9J7_BRAOL